MTVFLAFAANAQTITINSVTTGPYYTFGDIDVDYTAAGYPAGTTFYLIVDANSNGYLDAEDDNEDYVLASSTSLTGVLEGEIPNMTGTLDFWVVAGEDGTIGEVISETSEIAGNLTSSGTLSFAYPLSMDQDMTERSIETPDYDLTSDDYFTLVLDVDATDVVPANDLVVEVSEDGGAYTPLTDQQGDASFSASNGELIFAISQTLNVSNVSFRISQNNSATIAAATETWTLSSIDLIEYSGTLVQYNEESVGSLFVNAPTFTINSETYGSFVGEDIEVDYSALGFTTGATFYLYSGDILDPETRTIYDSEVSINGLFEGTWPLEDADENVNVYIAGVYGNIDEPELDFTNDDLNVLGASNSDFNFNFENAGVREVSTDELDLSGEEYLTLEVQLWTGSNLTTDNALLIQYSTDGSSWVDLEDEDGLDEIDGNVFSTFYYPIPSAAISSATKFRVRQKSINLTQGNQWWYLYNLDLLYYLDIPPSESLIETTFVNNYNVTVTSIEDADNVEIANNMGLTGGTVYPGDEITVTGEVAGFDVGTDEVYTVLINNTFLLDNEDVSIDGVTDEIVIKGNIPTDVEYANASDIQIKIYDGAEPFVAVNESVFADYNEEEDIIVVGDDEVEDGDTKVEFTLAGDRSLTTPEFQIASTADLTLSFFLNRTNSVRSPSGTEVVVEYSTDGTSFTEIQSFSINEAGQSGETYELDNTVLPSGMASPTTSIRFRQASNNGLNLDAWELQSITLMGGTNISEPGYINYNGLDLDILEPAITLTAIDNANLDLYPGTDLDIEFEVVGDFPAGTTYELLMDIDTDRTLSLGDFTASGVHSITVPAVIADTYSVFTRASHEETESNSVDLVVLEVGINNISITSTDAIADGSSMIVYPGNTIDISYDVTGDIGSEDVANLEIFDNESSEYMTIVEGETVDGTLSASLPLGIDYNSNDADFRLTITDGNLLDFMTIDETWNTSQASSIAYFPLDDREGYNVNNWFYNIAGERSATSIPLDFAGGGRFKIGLKLLSGYFSFEQDVFLQYSLDEGETWVELASARFETDNVDFFPDYIDIPEEAWVNDVLIRFISNESGAATGVENIIYLTGITVEQSEEFPIASETFSLQPDLILEELSVSQSTLEENDFILGEELVVEYNAEGPFPSDVEFAIVLKQGVKYVTLAETDQTGAVQTTVNIPVFPFENTNLSYDLEVVPFIRTGANDVFRAAEETETVMEEADILSIEGRATSGVGATGYSDFEFSQSGNRSLLTRAFDLEDFGSAQLKFDFEFPDGEFSTLLTLPELQVSIDDGATFQTLEVTDALYEAEGLVYPTGSYTVDIPETYLTAATHFRWIQKLNLGEDEDTWMVSDIEVVKGETNELNDQIYTTFNNPQSININVPSIDDYIWEQSDAADAAFNGETFNYNWDFDPDFLSESNFPDGTEYVFTIDVTDPETGEDVVIGSTSMLGSNFEASVPLYVENGTYDVMLTATITDGEEEYFLFEDEDVADLDVFLKAITISYLGDENAVIYAGNTVTFGIEVENDESTTNDFSTFNSNLILEYGGDDWLLASQLGIGDISADLPPFVNGNSIDFRVELSENGPIGEVGSILDESAIGTLEDNADNFIAGDVFTFSYVDFESNTGRGVVTTRDFEVGELDDALLFEFDITFNQLPEDLTADQNIIFEFSTDGGATYTELGSFPEADAEMTLNNETFGFEVTSDMKTNATRLRWRQEEIKGTFRVEEIGFTFAEALPFDYVGTEIDISQQALLISSIDVEEACMADDITLSYEIRGRFGADNVVNVYYRDENFSTGLVDGFEFNVTEGTGTMVINVPSDVLNENDDNEEFEFRLYTNDQTFSDIGEGFSFYGPYSEQEIEIVAPVDTDASFNLPSQTLCEAEEVIVTINNLQNYSTYELFNVEDGTVLGTLVYDPEVGDNEINLGVLTESVEIGMTVMSSTSSGNLTCNTVTSSYTDELTINENFELYVYDYDNAPEHILVVAGDSKTVCEGASSGVFLSVRRENGSQGGNVEWFRDDLNNPVSTSSTIQTTTLSEAGAYFARVTDGSCTYISESFIIEHIPTPDIPEITVVSGDLGTCDGTGEVLLEATAGFTYYEWSTGETTQQITVDEEGNYSVTVSNVPFQAGCTSTSEVLELETTYSQEFTIRSSTQGVFLLGGETVNDCDATTIQFYDDEYNNSLGSNSGLYTAYRDGVAFKTTTSSSISIDQSGEYSFEWTNDELNGVCTTTSPTITINIFDSIEDAPAITVVSGDLLFCEGDGEVVLSAPEGFSFYEWSGGNVDGSGARTVTATQGATYTVRVSNLPFGEGCASPNSAPVVLRQASSPEFQIMNTTFVDEDNKIGEGSTVEACDSQFIYFFEDNSWANNGTVVLFRDGVEYASIFDRSFELTESGSYTAEKRGDDINIACVRNIGAFTVTINEAPTDVPVLTSTGDLEFCTGEGNSVTLTAPTGFAVYNWFRNGVTISANTAGFDATSNTLEVIENGTYAVQVGNVANCYSPVSNIITVSTKNLPSIPGVSQSDATCGPGPVTFTFNGDNLYSYQLINALTGQASGNPVVGGDAVNSFITSASISEETPFYLEVSYADGSGCTTFNEFSTFTGEPNNVNLELDGNTLQAVIANYSGYSEIRWYRNGTELSNRVNNTSITITDGAEYMVEVDFEGVGLCTVTSNAIDLSGAATVVDEGIEGIQGSAYPNPAIDNVNVTIEGQAMGEYEVSIMTLSGQVLMSKILAKDVEDFEESVDIQSLQPGIYNLLIRKGKETKSMRIVKTQ